MPIYNSVSYFSISKGSKKLIVVKMFGGGGEGVDGSHKSKWYRLPIYNFVSYDYNWTLSHTAVILDSKMVSIIAFSNYVDVKQIYVDKNVHTLLKDILTECLPFIKSCPSQLRNFQSFFESMAAIWIN